MIVILSSIVKYRRNYPVSEPAASFQQVREIQQQVAADVIEMVKRHLALNTQEQRLMDSIVAEVGVKYGLLPPIEGFKIDRLEERIQEWF